MADSRFYDNRGPFPLDRICAHAGIVLPADADGGTSIFDVAGLDEAGPPHLSFFDNKHAQPAFAKTKAGHCLVGEGIKQGPRGTVLLECSSVTRTFGKIASLFYPEHELGIRASSAAIDPSAELEEGVVIAPGAVIGHGAKIGANSRIGANAVIGRGVCIGRSCEIGASAVISFALVGDFVVVQPGAVIGGSGFGFTSGQSGPVKVPQLGRVIVQDHVEIGANTTIDRGMLSDTVIGEGTKIDNLVQIGHNSRTGRHCILVAQTGLAGSVVLGDSVVLGGMIGVTQHVTIGAGAQVAGKSGVTGNLEGGKVYGGIPARPIQQWHREVAALSLLAKRSKRTKDE
jgi:UDP-3-O-[3-hydroxymyristoyl] glucosamine N-acyltransferase